MTARKKRHKDTVRREDCPEGGGEADFCLVTVDDVVSYLRAIDRLFAMAAGPGADGDPPGFGRRLWYRGQAQASPAWKLLPGIARHWNGARLDPECEAIFLSRFKSRAIPCFGKLPSHPPDRLSSYWTWLFLMQHYGLPTRLLDWTSDALAALVFALDPAGLPGENPDPDLAAAVWVLDPAGLNEALNFHPDYKRGYIPNVEEEIVCTLFGPDAHILPTKKPVAALAPMSSARIIAQKGVFTVFPLDRDLAALEDFPDSPGYLRKICIDCSGGRRRALLDQLRRYGSTICSLHPDFDRIADEFREEGC